MEPVSLTILGALGSIATIFNQGSQLVKKYRNRKHKNERKKVVENKILQKSAKRCHKCNKKAYHDTRLFCSRKVRFEDEIARSQFKVTEKKVKKWIDMALASSKDETSIVFPKAYLLRADAEEIQSSIDNNIAGLYQRVMQASPIPTMGYPSPIIHLRNTGLERPGIYSELIDLRITPTNNSLGYFAHPNGNHGSLGPSLYSNPDFLLSPVGLRHTHMGDAGIQPTYTHPGSPNLIDYPGWGQAVNTPESSRAVGGYRGEDSDKEQNSSSEDSSDSDIGAQFCKHPDIAKRSSRWHYKCHKCGWKGEIKYPMIIKYNYDLTVRAVAKSHALGQNNKFICRVCLAVKSYSGIEACLTKHGIKKIKKAYPSSSLRYCGDSESDSC
ncbi:nuclear protein ES2 [Apiospora arundinis]